MAKGKKRTQPARPRRKAPRPTIKRPLLDKPALDYTRLLADPCAGPLVHGLAPDGSGGFIVRLETDLVINGSATDVGAFLAFTPGINTYELSNAPITSDGGAITPSSVGFSSFLQTTPVGSYRALAACIQVMWPGTELNRSGVVALGQVDRAELTSASLSTGNLRTLAPNVERTPATFVEQRWHPNEQDLNWNSDSSGDQLTAGLKAKRGSIYVAAFGIPVSTGLRVRMVGVYEWKPLVASGLTVPVSTQTSSNTMSDALRVLESAGNWAYSSANAAGRTLDAVTRGMSTMGRFATYAMAAQAMRVPRIMAG
jgi:hypothetical protein